MTENIERLLVNGSNEPNGDETSEFIKQEITILRKLPSYLTL